MNYDYFQPHQSAEAHKRVDQIVADSESALDSEHVEYVLDVLLGITEYQRPEPLFNYRRQLDDKAYSGAVYEFNPVEIEYELSAMLVQKLADKQLESGILMLDNLALEPQYYYWWFVDSG